MRDGNYTPTNDWENTNSFLGAWATTGTGSIIGSIGYCAVYNRVLSASEIQRMFEAKRSRFGV